MKMSRDKIIAELEILKVGYSEEMTTKELTDLLKKAKAEAKAKEEEEKLDADIDYTGVKCGLATIQDLHRRLTICERKLKLKK